jgi:hypothetical protein
VQRGFSFRLLFVVHAAASVVQSCLDHLRDPLLNDAVVRDLRNGEWSAFCLANVGSWHPRAKELLRKLKTQNRIFPCPVHNANVPADAKDWCVEALASNGGSPLDGIITTHTNKGAFRADSTVASIEALGTTTWWMARNETPRLVRTTAAYIAHLARVLRWANSVMFVDRNLDPSKYTYRDFHKLVAVAAGRNPPPAIEIHRVGYTLSEDKRPQDINYWRGRFRPLHDHLLAMGTVATVYFWDDMHDRYFISDIVGVQMPNGFDTTTDPNSITTWSRLSRNARDDVQREFDPATGRHKLHYTFIVGK